MKAEVALGFRIIRRGGENDPGRSYYCEHLMGGRVTSVSPAREREFVLFSMLDTTLAEVDRLKAASTPKARVEKDDDGDLVVVADGDGS